MNNKQLLLQQRAAYRATADRILRRAAGDGRELTADEQRDVDGLLSKIADCDRTIRLLSEADDIRDGFTPRALSAPDSFSLSSRESLGIGAARMIRCLASARGNTLEAAQLADRMGHASVARALAAGTGSAGGVVVPEETSAEIIEYLRPMSAVMSLRPTIVGMPSGNLSVPKITGGATAAYLGENTNIGKTQQTFGNLKLTARKLAGLVPISNDLLRFGSSGADGMIRDDLAAALAQTMDLEFIRGDGAGSGPKGLRYWAPAANLLNVNATVNLANVTADLGKLLNALMSANVRMLRPGWIMAPRTMIYLMTIRDTNGNFAFRDEMLQGRLWGYPFRSTTQIPINLAVTNTNESEIYFADFADVVVGEAMQLEISVTSEGAYHDGSALVSAFSQDQTVIRAIMQHDMGMRHPASVAVLIDVDWQ